MRDEKNSIDDKNEDTYVPKNAKKQGSAAYGKNGSSVDEKVDDVKVAINKKDILSYAGAGLLVLVIIWIFFGVLSSNHKHKDTGESASNVDDSSALNQEARKLNQKSDGTIKETSPINPNLQLPPLSQEQKSNLDKMLSSGPSVSPEGDQAYKMRLNQPTLIYSDKGPSGASQGKGAQTVSGLSSNDTYGSFANNQATSVSTIQGQQVKHPDWTVLQGEFIHATLDAALNTDLPGMLNATVSTSVYSYTGSRVLIPKGSRLMGQYSTSAGNGLATSRIFIVWNRVVTPDGLSIMINSGSTDSIGEAGVAADEIYHHFIAIFGGGFLYSILGATAATMGVSSQTQPNSANEFQSQISQQLTQTGQQQLQNNANIKPTLLAWQGKDINVYVAHDLDLYNALAMQRNSGFGA